MNTGLRLGLVYNKAKNVISTLTPAQLATLPSHEEMLREPEQVENSSYIWIDAAVMLGDEVYLKV